MTMRYPTISRRKPDVSAEKATTLAFNVTLKQLQRTRAQTLAFRLDDGTTDAVGLRDVTFEQCMSLTMLRQAKLQFQRRSGLHRDGSGRKKIRGRESDETFTLTVGRRREHRHHRK